MNYYAPFYRPMGYYNPSIPNGQDNGSQFNQPYQQPIQPMQQTPTVSTNDMIWVLNENEATSYPVAPNNSVVLWDKNNPTIYVKSVNMHGIPSMRTLDFVERNADMPTSQENAPKTHECHCGDKFVTKEQFDDLNGKINALEAKYNKLTHPTIEKSKTSNKKSKEENE